MENANLAHVRSEEEQLFLSQLIERRHASVSDWHIGGKLRDETWHWITMVKVWRPRKAFGGSRSQRRRRFRAKANSITENFWSRLHKDNPRKRCMILSRVHKVNNQDVIYTPYYWYASWCTRPSGINFICQRNVLRQLEQGICGRVLIDPPGIRQAERTSLKIINGNRARFGRHPWHAVLTKLKTTGTCTMDNTTCDSVEVGLGFFCGATIISEFWILSAAHCFNEKRRSLQKNLRIVVGKTQRFDMECADEIFEVEKIIAHPNFQWSMKDPDIILVKVKPRNGKGITFNRYVQPVCLPGDGMVYVGNWGCWMTGWGRTSGYRYTLGLREARLFILDDRICEGESSLINSTVKLCAHNMLRNSIGHGGDSGGPLVCSTELGTQVVVGITSIGNKRLTLFTRVETYTPWILDTIQHHSSHKSAMTLPRPESD